MMHPVALTVVLVMWAAPAADAECKCDVSKLKGGWCSKCETGYLAGVRIKSEFLFEVLDAHGHDIDPGAIRCASCKEARKSNSFCDQCRRGWIDNRLYMSRLTYHLTKGEPKILFDIKCAICKEGAARGGWCEKCRVGMVGNVAIKDKTDFDHAAGAYRRLLVAVRLSSQCEMCAVALMSDGRCTKCKKTYKNGEVVSDGQQKE